jgi:hypothetical protein
MDAVHIHYVPGEVNILLKQNGWGVIFFNAGKR